MTAQAPADTLPLRGGASIPSLGLGVFQIPAAEAQHVVEDAIELGYRHIDTAAAYGNEAAVGAAIRACGVPRDELFVTSKLRNGDQGHARTRRAHDETLQRLGLAWLDLYLVHWPYPSGGQYVDSWRALTELHAERAVRAVGVSNFLPEHLAAVADTGLPAPVVNQVELHPTFQQAEVVAATQRVGALVEAYSPLGQGADLSAPVVVAAAREHGATPAQVVLAWHLARGHVAIPKSSQRQRLAENLASRDVRLTDEEVNAITALESGNRIGGDPATFALTQIR